MKHVLLISFLFTALLGTASENSNENLTPTEDQALIEVVVTDMENNIKVGDQILLVGETSGTTFEGVTSDNGRFKILLPEGDTYMVKIKTFGDQKDYSMLEIPKAEGMYTGTITIQYELGSRFTLDDLFFDTDKAIIRKTSYPSLDELAHTISLKKDLLLEIAGHTDNVGDDEFNQQLSKDRAEAVRQYLINQGVAADQLIAKGYGESQPVADNASPEGRQRNRRTELRVIQK